MDRNLLFGNAMNTERSWEMKLRVILFVCLLLILTSCQTDPSTFEAQTVQSGKKILTFAEPMSIPTMDTTQATDSVSLTTMNNVFEGLTRLNEKNEPVLGMAESIEVSDDGTVYTFTIRADACWSNGTPVTAHDFVFAWRKALHPETLSPYAYIMEDLKNAAKILNRDDPLYGKVEQLGVEALSDRKLKVTLEQPIPYFLHLTAFPTFFPQNEQFVKQQGKNYGLSEQHLIFNGPFLLQDWQEEQGWKYVKNETYWDALQVKLDEVHFLVVKEPSTVIRLYQTGMIDRAGLAAEYVDLYRDHPDFQTFLQSSVSFIRINHQHQALKNVNIRRAIASAWDKEGIAKVLLNNGSLPAYYLVPKYFVTGPDGTDFRGEELYLHDHIDKAKHYWQQGLKELGTDHITLELLTYDSEYSSVLSQFIKNQLETNLPGLTIQLKPQPYTQKIALERALEYDLAFSGWGPDYADPMTFLDLFLSNSGNNYMGYTNKKYDQLILQAKASMTDFKQRWKLLKEAEKVLLEEDAAIIPMFQAGAAVLQRSFIKNLIVHPYGPGKTFKWTYIDERLKSEG